MITLVLTDDIRQKLVNALKNAGTKEIGGVLMGEHIGPNLFKIVDITIHRPGTFSSFIRKIEEVLGKLNDFFDKTKKDFTRFNYLGEWHSHPSFTALPSEQDDFSMFEIIEDPKVGANFAVLMIVKLDRNNQFIGTVHTYLPGKKKFQAELSS